MRERQVRIGYGSGSVALKNVLSHERTRRIDDESWCFATNSVTMTTRNSGSLDVPAAERGALPGGGSVRRLSKTCRPEVERLYQRERVYRDLDDCAATPAIWLASPAG